MSENDQRRSVMPPSEAEVAQRLLAAAKPERDAAREAALLERIMAAAERTPRLVVVGAGQPVAAATETATPAAVDHAPAVVRNVVASSRMPLRRAGGRRDLWAATSVLAASLLIGFLAGQMSLPNAAVRSLAEASGVSFSSATQDAAQVLAAVEDEDEDL